MGDIPKPKKISDKKIVEMLRLELKRKDSEIQKLKEENELLLKLSVKNAKHKLKDSK